MNKIVYSIIVSLLIIVASCKSTKKTTESKSVETSTNTTSHQAAAVLPDSVYRFVVSFISKGGGPDRSAKQQLSSFIQTFNSNNKVVVTPEIVGWGREGESDYCFKLSELSAALQEKFVNDTQELLKNSSRVRYSENSICRHKKK